jgi:hypothetical protein
MLMERLVCALLSTKGSPLFLFPRVLYSLFLFASARSTQGSVMRRQLYVHGSSYSLTVLQSYSLAVLQCLRACVCVIGQSHPCMVCREVFIRVNSCVWSISFDVALGESCKLQSERAVSKELHTKSRAYSSTKLQIDGSCKLQVAIR